MSTTTEPGYAQPALIGGLIMGVLSALPIVAAGNLCCCLWVLSGGAIAAYLLQQNQSTPIQPGDGALVGFLAGIIGALVQFVISIPVGILVAPYEQAMLRRVLDMAGSMPPEMREALERYSGRDAEFAFGFLIVRRIIALVFGLFVGGLFSTIGGLLGAMMFRKDTPPPGVIDIPPTSSSS
ncbi:MAG TPA: DUF5518 domain-containing protein [Vicinamibacterales bacterium]|nr:DUF5518 domain-containing protein [Vicinamibacterales bacterium]